MMIMMTIHFFFILYDIAALTEKENANGGESQETDADQYFEPLEMACQTRQPRLMEIALDSIHYLIGTYQFI